MTAVENLAEDLRMERDAVQHEIAGASLWGDGKSSIENPLGEDMRVMAGGNVTVNVTKPESKPEQVIPEVASKVAKTGLGVAAALALGGPVGLGLAAIPLITHAFSRPAVTQPADKPSGNPLQDYDLFVGPPKE